MMFDLAIIGGGISGSLLVIHLAKQAKYRIKITLYDYRGAFYRGIPYSTDFKEHIMNAPAKRMSCIDEDPYHLVKWLQQNYDRYNLTFSDCSEAFIPRHLFGTYVQSTLEETLQNNPNICLKTIKKEVVDIIQLPIGYKIISDDNSKERVHKAVLCTGFQFPATPYDIRRSEELLKKYIGNPWDFKSLGKISKREDVAIIGSGLSMVDVLLYLNYLKYKGKVFVVSRSGKFPQPQIIKNIPPEYSINSSCIPQGLLSNLRFFQNTVEKAREEGVPWEAVMTGFRPHFQTIWSKFTRSEKATFLRHLSSLWSSHRFRCPENLLVLVQRLIEEQRLHLCKGKIEHICADRGRMNLRISSGHSAICDWIINCTGSNTKFVENSSTLLQNLLKTGIIKVDQLGIGLEVNYSSQLIDINNRTQEYLFAIGILTRGVFGDITAITDIRKQCNKVAKKLLNKPEAKNY